MIYLAHAFILLFQSVMIELLCTVGHNVLHKHFLELLKIPFLRTEKILSELE